MYLLQVLKVGNALQNPAFYKKLQMLITLLGTLCPVIVIIFPSMNTILTPELNGKLSIAIGGINAYFIPATSEKIGI